MGLLSRHYFLYFVVWDVTYTDYNLAKARKLKRTKTKGRINIYNEIMKNYRLILTGDCTFFIAEHCKILTVFSECLSNWDVSVGKNFKEFLIN